MSIICWAGSESGMGSRLNVVRAKPTSCMQRHNRGGSCCVSRCVLHRCIAARACAALVCRCHGSLSSITIIRTVCQPSSYRPRRAVGSPSTPTWVIRSGPVNPPLTKSCLALLCHREHRMYTRLPDQAMNIGHKQQQNCDRLSSRQQFNHCCSAADLGGRRAHTGKLLAGHKMDRPQVLLRWTPQAHTYVESPSLYAHMDPAIA
jgi:hypothetical protein